MTKIMLVEDDKALREIYSIRLTAEGYTIVSASDGEEALATAVSERPDLIISDVMMPKISGFDMLDILRSTPETKDIKVIMMTALSSEDQRQRGENLGADKYLVKSQVGIEDVINAVHEVLGDKPVAVASSDASASVATPANSTTPASVEASPAEPAAENASVAPVANPQASSPAQESNAVPPVTMPAQAQVPVAPTPASATPQGNVVSAPVATVPEPVAQNVAPQPMTPATVAPNAHPENPPIATQPVMPTPPQAPVASVPEVAEPQAQAVAPTNESLVKNGTITPPPQENQNSNGMTMAERMAAELAEADAPTNQ